MPEHRPAPVEPALDSLRQTYGLDFDEVMELIDTETLNEQERRLLEEARAGAVRAEAEVEHLLQDLLNGPKRVRKGVQMPQSFVESDESDQDESYSSDQEYPVPAQVQTHLTPTQPLPGTLSVEKWWLRK